MSKIVENLRVAFTALITNKFRAFLTTIGIGIGIAAVVILVSLGQAVQDYVTNQFLSVGSDLIYIQPATASRGVGFGPGAGRGGLSLSSLTTKDLALVQDPFNIPNVKTVIPLIQVQGFSKVAQNTDRPTIYGTTTAYFDTLNRQVVAGRLFEDQDVLSGARVVVIGQTSLKNLFPGQQNAIGETIHIRNVPFQVIGVLETYGGASFGADQDDVMFMPITTAELHLESDRALSGATPISQIYMQAADINSIDSIVSSAEQLIRTEHKIKPGNDDDFQVTAQKDLLNSFDQVIGVLTIFLAVIGGISLVVGGIGVMNIMLVTVTERTREIGLRKAVGARGFDIMIQFLIEALFLCGIGGGGGLILASVVTYIIRAVLPALAPSVNLIGVVLAVGITTLIGVFFGLYPASRAAALNPIQALRTE